jgi:hypothetical protein
MKFSRQISYSAKAGRRWALSAVLFPLACLANAQEDQTCDSKTLELASRFVATADASSPSGAASFTASACAPYPLQADKRAIALARPGAKTGTSTFDLLVLDSRSGQVLFSKQRTIDEDAATSLEGSRLRIEPMRYELASGVYAFAVDFLPGYSATCAPGRIEALRSLYLVRGRAMQIVLAEQVVEHTMILQGLGERCGGRADEPTIVHTTRATLQVRRTSSHGLRDIQIQETTTRTEGPAVPVQHKRLVLKYDGQSYRASR